MWFSCAFLKTHCNKVLPKTQKGANYVANLAFEITLSETITLTLLLVCSFFPQVQKYLVGSPKSLKSQNFDAI